MPTGTPTHKDDHFASPARDDREVSEEKAEIADSSQTGAWPASVLRFNAEDGPRVDAVAEDS